MLTIINNDKNFLDTVLSLQNSLTHYYALHINFSAIDRQSSSKIKIQTLSEYFEKQDGFLFVSYDGDVIIIFSEDNDAFIRECRQEIISKFFGDDISSSQRNNLQNALRSYIIKLQWEEFFLFCKNKTNRQSDHQPAVLTASILADIEQTMTNIDLSHVLRHQAICSISEKKITPVFNEMYVNMLQLKRTLMQDVDLTGHKALFRCLTMMLDQHMLNLLRLRPSLFPKDTAVSLNLNVESILSGAFAQFDASVRSNPKLTIIIEIDIGDVFNDINNFIEAKNYIQSLGYRICLDGLTNFSFMEIDRQSLGFDMVKLQWNEDVVEKLNSNENLRLAKTIQRFGRSRVILCRCCNKNAIDYGKALGIPLFQGRYIDSKLNPMAKTIN